MNANVSSSNVNRSVTSNSNGAGGGGGGGGGHNSGRAGEELYVRAKNMAFMSTRVTCGEARGLVVAKGDQTAIGKLANQTAHTAEKPISMDVELNHLVTIIIVLDIIIAVAVLVWMMTYLRIWYAAQTLSYNAAVQNVISAMVSFIPNSLPATVAASLLVMVRRMQRTSNVLVKKLSVIESFSAVNMLLCDKTGTLTRNTMTLAAASVGLEPLDLVEMKRRRAALTPRGILGAQQLIKACALCNNSRYEMREADTDKRQKDDAETEYERVLVGDATDTALARFASEFGGSDVESLRDEYVLVGEVPFRSENKCMMRVVRPIAPAKCPFRKTTYSDVCFYFMHFSFYSNLP